jgi:UDP-glucose 4-epimerase
VSSYLITGGTGFIGGHLVDSLSEAGHAVTCLVRRPRSIHDSGGSVKWVHADLLQPESYEHLMPEMDYVVHSAGIINSRRPEKFFETNVLATRILLEACARARAPRKRFVLMSSIAAMGPNHTDHPLKAADPCRPESEYGKSKLEAELVANQWSDSIPLVIIRPSFVYGRGDLRGLAHLESFWSPAPSLASSLIRNFSVCHISDLVAGCRLAMEVDSPSGGVFIMSDPEVHTWSSAQAMLEKILGDVFPPELWPRERRAAGGMGRLASIELPAGIQQFWGCDVTETLRVLGFSPEVSLENGARDVIQWYLKEGLLPPGAGAAISLKEIS